MGRPAARFSAHPNGVCNVRPGNHIAVIGTRSRAKFAGGAVTVHLLRWREIGAVFAVEKPGHLDGKKTLRFQFFDRSGHSAFKVFLGFGGSIPPEKAERFTQVRDAFRKQ